MEENVNKVDAENAETINEEKVENTQRETIKEAKEEKHEKIHEAEAGVNDDMVTVRADGKIYDVPSSLKPISTWGYFGYEMLFFIPFIGLVVAIIFALGGTSNVNLRNFARSRFCMLLVLLVILGIAFLFGGAVVMLDYFTKLR